MPHSADIFLGLFFMHRLCSLNNIPDNQSKGFNIAGVSFFVVRKQQAVHVYLNQCPHLGIPLEWQTDQFLDSTNSLIVCAMHGAQFLIESGQCISGPCSGQALTPIEHRIEDDHIWVSLPATPADSSTQNA